MDIPAAGLAPSPPSKEKPNPPDQQDRAHYEQLHPEKVEPQEALVIARCDECPDHKRAQETGARPRVSACPAYRVEAPPDALVVNPADRIAASPLVVVNARADRRRRLDGSSRVLLGRSEVVEHRDRGLIVRRTAVATQY